MRNRVVGSLRGSEDPKVQQAAKSITQNFVFEYPTIKRLASAISSLVGSPETLMDPQRNRAREAEELVQKYTASLPVQRGRQANVSSGEIVVLLTGSTGNIGSHILAALLGDDRITKVYTLNRPSLSSGDRLVTAFEDRNLPVQLLSQTKLSSFTGDLSQDLFGLPEKTYEEVPLFLCPTSTLQLTLFRRLSSPSHTSSTTRGVSILTTL